MHPQEGGRRDDGRQAGPGRGKKGRFFTRDQVPHPAPSPHSAPGTGSNSPSSPSPDIDSEAQSWSLLLSYLAPKTHSINELQNRLNTLIHSLGCLKKSRSGAGERPHLEEWHLMARARGRHTFSLSGRFAWIWLYINDHPARPRGAGRERGREKRYHLSSAGPCALCVCVFFRGTSVPRRL